ncbi:hypothetical protein M0804_005742 [Polistes exclamans]|nr:hypothetical protein M0804_005742 [Polistes exclamans]
MISLLHQQDLDQQDGIMFFFLKLPPTLQTFSHTKDRIFLRLAQAWSTRTYCCQQDGCNSGPSLTSNSNGYVVVLTLTMLVLILERSLRG